MSYEQLGPSLEGMAREERISAASERTVGDHLQAPVGLASTALREKIAASACLYGERAFTVTKYKILYGKVARAPATLAETQCDRGFPLEEMQENTRRVVGKPSICDSWYRRIGTVGRQTLRSTLLDGCRVEQVEFYAVIVIMCNDKCSLISVLP
jgi:hypothetical protein